MADNTQVTSGTGDVIATDELTTLNGGAVSGFKVQRMKVGFGSDAALRDVDAANPLPVTGPLTDAQLRATSVPVSAASLPLPTGAATETTAAGIRTDLGTDGTTPPAVLGTGTGVRGWLRSIYEKLTGTLAVTGTFWQATQPVSGAFFQATQPVSAATLPLPSGAATETTVAGVRTDLGTDGTTPPAVLGTGTGVRGWLRSIYEKLTGTLAVTGTFWQATQPVSGAFFQATQPVSGPLTDTQLRATAVPVSGAFFQAAQPITDNAGSLTVDAPVGTPAFVRLSDGTAAIATLPVSGAFFQATQPVSGAFFQATQPVSGTFFQAAQPITDNAGSLTVDAPVGTPVFVRLSDGAAAVASLVAADLTSGNTREQLFDVQTNQTSLISSLRHHITGSVTRVFGDSFADGIGAGEEDAGAFPTTATVTGTATGTAANGQLTMTTGVTGGATGSLQSSTTLPFVTGSVANNQNGMTFPSANLTAFRVVSRRAGVDTVVESSAFNVVPTAITNSGTAGALAGSLVNGVLHRCDIFYQGNAAIFAIDGVAVHRMAGQIAAPRTDTLDLPTFFEWTSTAAPAATLRAGQYNASNGYFFECQYNVANVTMACRGTSSSRLGPAPRTQKVLQGFDPLRTRVVIKFEAVAPATADTLLSLVKQTAGVDAAGATSIGVTANKVLRITGGRVSCKSNAAAIAFSTLTLRQNPAGATAIGSPSWGRYDTENTAAVANDSRFAFFTFDEAQEFSGVQTLGASLSAQAITNIMSIVLYGYEYNIGN